MKARFLVVLAALLALAGLFPTPALADGIIIPGPPICPEGGCPPPPPCLPPTLCPPPVPLSQLDIRYHHVTVKIDNQVAVTHVDQVFYNPNDWTVEGDYVFPLPLDAAVSSFTLWVDGQPVQGQVLDAKQARQKYEEIVRSQRDPALLEYAGRGAVEAHIFPIPPEGERRVELEYTQVLAAESGLVHYLYPLNTEKFSAQPLESVSVSVEIASPEPIRAVYSPSHEISVSRPDDHHALAGYEAQAVRPDTDFSLYYSVGESQAFHLLTYRDPADPTDPDGFFLLLLAPRPEVSAQPVPKDVLLVLDRSGSMDGEKFRQAQQASAYILAHLNPDDRFDVLTFSTGVESYAPSLRPAGEASKASRWVESQSAAGATDINRALLEASSLADRERPTYLIFLTDGLPTQGETDRDKILANLAAQAPANLRLFAFGVGYDVDTVLLDSLAQEHHGLSQYVRPGEALDETLSGFYARISTPVLTGLQLDFGGLSVSDLYPDPLPDLFLGSQIVVVGRYRQGGTATVTLTGQVNGETQVFPYPDQVFSGDSLGSSGLGSTLPRLWATRKIGALLTQVRLHGPDKETVDQIVRLSIRYGIVTPYTSYLVTEPQALGAGAQEQIANQEYDRLKASGPAPASGQAAVEQAAGQGSLAGAAAPAASTAETAGRVRQAGSHTFVQVDGVWTDTAYDPQTTPTQKVAFLSGDYFRLAGASPDLAAALSLGERVIVLSDGKAYEVVAADAQVPQVDLPTPANPAPTQPARTPTAPSPTAAPAAAPTSTPASPAATGSAAFPIPYAAGAVVLGLVLCAPIVIALSRRR